MDEGVIRQIGAPLDLYDTPENLFVASFVGSPSMNLISGTVRFNGGLSVEAHGITLPLTEDHHVTNGQPVVYGIRPEHLDLAEDGIPAKIAVVEPTGPETLVSLRFGESEIVAVFRERHKLAPGQILHLRPRRDQAHLFDNDSGARI